MGIFSRKNKTTNAPVNAESSGDNQDMAAKEKPKPELTFKGNPARAKQFFAHGKTVATARNYDYAIDCYINGLRENPDNLAKHEQLRDVALRRKVSGAKPAGMGERMKGFSGNIVDKMLQAEKLSSMDPLNVKHMRDFMNYAVQMHEQYENLKMKEVAFWIGGLLLDHNVKAKKPNKNIYIQARDLFARINAYGKAVDACKRALMMSPDNDELKVALRDLEAERTMEEGNYITGEESEGDFADIIEGQKAEQPSEAEADKNRV